MSLVQDLFNEYQSVPDAYSLIQELDYHFQLASEETERYQQLLELAKLFGRSGFIEFKLAILIELWKINPEASIAYLIAQQFFVLNQLELASEWMERLTTFAMNEEMRLLQVQLLRNAGQHDEEKKILDQLLKENPQSVNVYYQLALYFINEQDSAKAKEFLNVIIEYFPDSPCSEEARSLLIQTMVDSEMIEPHKLTELVNHQSLPELGNADQYLQVAKAYFLVEQYDEALKFAQKTFEMDKDNLDSVFMQLQIAVFQNQREIAQTHLNWLERNMPIDHEIIGEVAVLAEQLDLMTKGLVDKLVDYVILLEDSNDQFEYIQLVTRYYVKTKQPLKLEKFADTMAEEMDEPVYLSYAYAKFFEMTSNFVEAEAYYLDSLELALNIPTLVLELAKLYLHYHENELAKSLIEQYQNTLYDIPELKQLEI